MRQFEMKQDSQEQIDSRPVSIPEHHSINSPYKNNISPSSPSSIKKQFHYHIFSNINNTSQYNTQHIDAKSIMSSIIIPPITPIDFPPISPSIMSSTINSPNFISSTNKKNHFSYIQKPFNIIKSILSIVTNKVTDNFRPIRPNLSVNTLSVSVSEYKDDTDIIQFEQDKNTGKGVRLFDFVHDHDVADNSDNDTARNKLKLIRVNSNATIVSQKSYLTNTPTTDYATFQLNTSMAISPFVVRKSSFLSLHEKHLYNKSRKSRSLLLNKNIEKEENKIETTASDTIFGNQQEQISKLNVYQTIFTIVNLYVNNTMLLNPYALKRGGLFSIILFGFICVWLCYSGKLMIHLLSKVPNYYRTFTGIILYSMGYLCCCSIGIFIILANMGRSIVCLITMWDNILYLFQYIIYFDLDINEFIQIEYELQINIAIISSILLVLPTICMLHFSDLILDTILGFISTSLLAIIVIINFILKISTDNNKIININWFPEDLYGLVLCIGIFISNLAGHACLPTIYSQMKDQKKYNYSLNISWIIIFIIHSLTGICGYCTYGNLTTKTLITLSIVSTKSNVYLSTILIACVILNLFVHVPIGVSIVGTLLEQQLQMKHHLIKRIFRTIIFMIIVYTSWILLKNIALLSAVMGSILTLTISVLCPLLSKIYLQIHFYQKYKFIILIFIIILFLSFSGFMLYVLLDFNTPSKNE